jgi:ribonuclease HI
MVAGTGKAKKAGWGLIVRDSTGDVKLSAWQYLPGCASAEQLEALACLEGPKQIIDLRCWPATIETDCLRVVTAIATASADRSSLWCLYREINELLRLHPDIRIQKVDRECNKVAHVLAQLGKRESCGVLRESAPTSVSTLTAEDCKNIIA